MASFSLTLVQRFQPWGLGHPEDSVPLRDERSEQPDRCPQTNAVLLSLTGLGFLVNGDPALKRWAIVSRKETHGIFHCNPAFPLQRFNHLTFLTSACGRNPIIFFPSPITNHHSLILSLAYQRDVNQPLMSIVALSMTYCCASQGGSSPLRYAERGSRRVLPRTLTPPTGRRLQRINDATA